MFLHIYINRLKCIFRDKQMMFWTFLFPILLGTMFFMSLTNISKTEVFTDIKIAVVDNAEFRNDKNFQEMLNFKDDKGKALFNIKYTTQTDADKLLLDNKIQGYILYKDEAKLVVKKSGINQSIIKEILDTYKQSVSTVGTIAKTNPVNIQKIVKDISNRGEYLSEVKAGRSAPDTTVNYFYTLIAMACLYGGFLGLKEVMAIQANQSTQAARVNMAPVNKMKVFTISMLAAATVQLLEIVVLYVYLTVVLKIDFGNQLGYIALTSVIGTLTGVTFGAFIAAVIKTGEGMKIAVLIASSMIMSFMSGMMYAGIKLVIRRNAPILSYINPGNLIADSFYSLYYYTNHTHYYTNLLILCGFTLLFSLTTYFVLRRQKYASL